MSIHSKIMIYPERLKTIWTVREKQHSPSSNVTSGLTSATSRLHSLPSVADTQCFPMQSGKNVPPTWRSDNEISSIERFLLIQSVFCCFFVIQWGECTIIVIVNQIGILELMMESLHTCQNVLCIVISPFTIIKYIKNVGNLPLHYQRNRISAAITTTILAMSANVGICVYILTHIHRDSYYFIQYILPTMSEFMLDSHFLSWMWRERKRSKIGVSDFYKR